LSLFPDFRRFSPTILAVLAQEDAGTPLVLGDDLLAYLVLAFGGALFVGNLLAVLRPPPTDDGSEAVRAPLVRSLVMATLGLVAALWGIASLVKR
jgi:hypothetical protein